MRSVGACALFFPLRLRCMSCTESVCHIKPCQHTKSISKSSKQTPALKNHNKNRLCKCLHRLGAALGLLANCPQPAQVWVPSSKAMQNSQSYPQAALPGGRGFLSVLNLIPVWQLRASPLYPLDQAQLEPKSLLPRVNTQVFYNSSVYFFFFFFSFINSSSCALSSKG